MTPTTVLPRPHQSSASPGAKQAFSEANALTLYARNETVHPIARDVKKIIPRVMDYFER